MKVLIFLTILLSLGLPSCAKFDDPECHKLMNLAKHEKNTWKQTDLIAQAYSVCYKNHPCDADCERNLQNVRMRTVESQLDTLQRQQNLNTYLLLQQNISTHK